MELWCFVSIGIHCMRVPEGHNEQRAIIFNDGDYLKMNARLRGYVPFEYEIYGANLTTSHENISIESALTWGNDTVHTNEPLLKEWNGAVVNIILRSLDDIKLICDVARLIYSESSEVSSACTKTRCSIDWPWLKHYPPADDENTYRYTAASIKKQPHVVSFKDTDLFIVALGLKNTSNRIDHVNLIFAYGREKNSQIIELEFYYELELNETFDQAYMKIQLCMDKSCGVSDMFPVIFLQYDDHRTDENCLYTRCNIILDFGGEESREYSNDESVEVSVVNDEGGLNKKNLVVCLCVVVVILSLIVVIIRVCRRFKKQGNPNEIPENIMSRPPMDLPPEVVYEEVYSHGAGLQRPRRQQARRAAPQHQQ